MGNPFSLVFGKNPEQNISRPVQTREITDVLDDDSPSQQVFMLTGIRGAGKTVMLTEIATHYREKEDWIVVDLNPNEDLMEGLLAKLANERTCLEYIKSAKINLSIFGIDVEFGDAPAIVHPMSGVERILEKVKEKNKHVLITIDEVTNNEYMRRFAGDMQILIRQEYPICVVMTGLYENIDELQNVDTLTFLYRAAKIYLKSLNLGAISRKYQEIFSLEKEAADSMAKLTDGYPFAFQVLGYLTYNNDGDYQGVLSDYRQYLEDYVYEKIWSELSDKDRQVAHAIASESTGKIKEIRDILGMETNSFNPYRKRLIRKGIIDGNDRGTVRFTLPMFKEFVLDQL